MFRTAPIGQCYVPTEMRAPVRVDPSSRVIDRLSFSLVTGVGCIFALTFMEAVAFQYFEKEL
jgi:hypothetical protein